MKHTIKHRIMLFAGALLAFAFSSCSTVKGVGKDVEKTGEGIQKAASQ